MESGNNDVCNDSLDVYPIWNWSNFSKENFSSMQLCQQALVSVDEKINRSRQVGAPYAGGICVQTSTGNQ